MDVNMVARQVGVVDPAVIAKAREYIRLASIRVMGGLGQGEVCKPSICLELACSSTGAKERPPREKFIRFGCTTAKVYQTSYLKLQRILQVVPATDLQDIALYLEATHLIEPVRQLLRVYEQRVLASLASGTTTNLADVAVQAKEGGQAGPLQQQQQQQQQQQPQQQPQQQQQQQQQHVNEKAAGSADFNRPVFAAAAFTLLGRSRKVKVDAMKLRQRLALTAADFNRTLSSMASLCSDLITSGPGPANKRKRGGESKEGIAEVQLSEEEGEGSQVVTVKPSAKRMLGGGMQARRMRSENGNGKKRQKQRRGKNAGRDTEASDEHEQEEVTEGLELECRPATDLEDELVLVEDRGQDEGLDDGEGKGWSKRGVVKERGGQARERQKDRREREALRNGRD